MTKNRTDNIRPSSGLHRMPCRRGFCLSLLFELIAITMTLAIFPCTAQKGSSAKIPSVTEKEQTLLKTVRTTAETNPAAAVTKLQKHIDDASSAALPYTLGILYMRQEKPEKAVSVLRDALARTPTFNEARRSLADALLQAERYEEAASAYRTLLQKDPSNQGRYWKRLGYLFLRQNKPVAAESAYRNALTHQPEKADVREGLLQALLEQNRKEEARWLIRQELAENPQRKHLWRILGDHALNQNRTTDALVLFECARRMIPGDEELLLSSADLYMQEDLPELALKAYTEAGQNENITQDNADRFLVAAQAFLTQEHVDKARELLAALAPEKIDLTSEQTAKRWYLTARGHMQKKSKSAEIVRALKETLRHDPLHGPALLHLGRQRMEQGKLDRALDAFRRATKVNEFRAKGLIGLARVAVQRKNYESAVSHLEKSLQLDPDSHVRRYMKRIKELKQ